MNRRDWQIEQISKVSQALGELSKRCVFVGGAILPLLITDETVTETRATDDVDLIIEVASRLKYAQLQEEVRKLGFHHVMDGPLCRFEFEEIIVDLMPTDPDILGFSNHWYTKAWHSASDHVLPAGQIVRVVSGPLYLCTKLEAFHDRGKNDCVMSHDFEDVISVIDGRRELLHELCQCAAEERDFLHAEFDNLLADETFLNTVVGMVKPQIAMRHLFVLRRMRMMASMFTSLTWLEENRQYLKWYRFDDFVRVGTLGDADVFLVSNSVLQQPGVLIELCQRFAKEVGSFSGKILMWVDPQDAPTSSAVTNEQLNTQAAEFSLDPGDGLPRLKLINSGAVTREIVADAN